MKVSDALMSRRSVRAFLPTPVPESTVRSIIETAARAPSGGNLQPWHVHAVAGAERERFLAIIKEKMKVTPMGEGSEYHIYPPELKEPYRTRRFRVGEAMYATMNIAREDKMKRLGVFAKNFEFFGAPVALFFTIDRIMQQGQWADLGMFMQSIMLLAREHGLHTCAQEAWGIWPKTVKEFLGISDEFIMFAGMALGYADESEAINSLRTERAPLAEYASFRGFA
ncbi:MAG TPA: nitroreductase [Micropepsaceae bacterium]|nr:nitroreductase [Micropepsaceae bacterium]